MAKPIQRDGFDTVETAAVGGLKGGLLGAVASFAVGALAVAGVIYGGALVLGGTALVASAAAGLTGTAIAVASIAGGIVTAAIGGSTAIVGGGLLGLAKGANKASKENVAYAQAVAQNPSIDQAKLVEAQNAGMQQGFQAGAQHVIEQLQAAQAAQQQMAAAQAPVTNHADKVGGPKMDAESYAKSILAQREAQQTAGAQLG